MIHDVALQNLPVVICIDRAGIVGEDGATHQGVFDLSFCALSLNSPSWRLPMKMSCSICLKPQ